MQKLLDIRFSFLCRTTHSDKSGQHPILLRISFRGERRDVFTGLYCFKGDWDKNTGKLLLPARKASLVNKNLDIIFRKANDSFDALRYANEPFSIGQLVEKIKGKENKPLLLIEFLEESNKAVLKRVGVEIMKGTYFKYRKSLQYMQEFLQKEFKVKNYTLNKVDTKFMEQYFYFLRTEKNIANNTALKYLTFVKTILTPAIRSGIIKSDPFSDLKFRHKTVHREFLSQEEIDMISTLELTDPDLDRKRDIFLFACYTGLAYVDLKQLHRENIVGDADGSFYIRKPRQKTGEESIIPLLPSALRIFKKYSPTNDIRDFSWYVSSNQKMNFGLKFITQRAALTKTLHMHMARHTFATTVTLSNGVPIESVSKMLGHANIRQTQHYAKVVAVKIKLDMDKIRALYS
jgi:site-specific recombinase XerD